MKIIELKSSNIKRLKAVELHFDENKKLVMITGRNGQGKSSLLDSIWMALGGKAAIPEKPIREGEEKGEVEINLDGYIVTRTFTDKGSYLKVVNKDGAKFSNPQEFLDFIMGNLSFDPLEFSRMTDRKKIEELTKISGASFEDIDQKKKELSQERILLHREINSMQKFSPEVAEEMRKLEAEGEISITDISNQISEGTKLINDYETAQGKKQLAENSIQAMKDEIESLNKRIIDEQNKLEELSKITKPEIDIEALKTKLADADKHNALVREAKAGLRQNEERLSKEKLYEETDAQIKAMDDEKEKRLSEAKLPVEGLSWTEDTVLYNGIPYSQISGAEQLKVSMAIAMASNPKLKVILIKDGSLLDSDNLAVIEEMAKDKDFQVFIESVNESDKIGIVIYDGEVVKNNYEDEIQ